MKTSMNFKIILTALVILASDKLTLAQVTAQPNVIIVFMDDMGLGDLSCYGAVGYKTSNIDKLASEGMRLTNFHSPQGTCTASRAALLTGCYPNRVGMHGAFGPNDALGLNPNEITIADMLKVKGYKTGMVGKWHLGNKPAYLPTVQGFDEYLGLPYSNDMWAVNFDGTTAVPGQPRYGSYPPLPLLDIRAGQNLPDTARIVQTLDDQSKLIGTYTDRAVKFIKENRKTPFFLYLAHSMPHVPIRASAAFLGKSGTGMYGDVMLEIDWSVGQIMKTLNKLKINDNTIIVFTSDNGPWLNFGNHGGSTAGLREGKGTSWEGGTHIPGIIRWPAKIKAGSVSNAFMSTIDILPTLSAITRAPLPQKKIDGLNVLDALTGKELATLSDRPFYYYYNQNDLEAVRKGHWKLILPHKYRSYEDVLPGKDGFPGPYGEGEQHNLALFDLRRDPGERYDVKEMFPDILKQLEALAEEARTDLGDNLTSRGGANRRLP
ncbi:sulfatase [Flavihumibacter sp. R14]|nr:sulfatase [Flavihumibacter soli]